MNQPLLSIGAFLMETYIAYFRVSTDRQGKSGLGLDVQKERVKAFVEDESQILNEYVEIQSGKRDKRIELENALKECRKTNSSLLIHKLDRFSRKVSFISNMMERGVNLVVVDMPNATDFQLHIYAALSQEERRQISERTKEALRQAKLRGTKLGEYGKVLAKKNHEGAIKFSHGYKDLVTGLIDEGRGYTSIANYLNANGYLSTQGKAFYPSTVKKMISYF